MHTNIIVIISSNLNEIKFYFNINLVITNMTNDFEFIYLNSYVLNNFDLYFSEF